ncbi:MAG: hypothetical protein IPF65_06830 [Polaromonas sp.]|nr:hypothetical protein [Polaromonas sp.]HRH05401.1 hypothetical protein [Burkholderiaceae bacterium]
MTKNELNNWSSAIATRIADEWSGATDFPNDAKLLRVALKRMLRNDSMVVASFIGSGIIEENYFEAK